MPNQSWCPFCSKPNVYDVTKPRFCGHCGKDMTTAFQTTPVSQPAGTPPKVVIASTPDPITLRRPTPLYAPTDTGRQPVAPEDYYSPQNVQARAAQLTASLRGGFHIALAEEGTHIKLGSLNNVRDAFSKAEAAEGAGPAKKTKARKR